jgi:hypothetical protein
VAIRSTDAAAMTERLAARGVVVSWREDKVRAMFHAYNNGADIDVTANRNLLERITHSRPNSTPVHR